MPWTKIDVMDQKQQFVMEALQPGVVFRDLCAKYGISTVTGYKIRKRFLQHGRLGLHEQSRRPHRNNAQLSEDTVCSILRLRFAHPTWGPEKLRVLFSRASSVPVPSLSSFKRVLAKAGLIRRYRTRKVSQQGSLPRVLSAPSKPNELWSVDFKGWWRTDTTRCEPLTVRDAYSRFVLCAVAMSSTATEPVMEQFEKLFRKHGLPDVIHSDNGTPFGSTRAPAGLTRLSAWWVCLGIQISRSRPAHPQDNGAHERMHKDMERELRPLIEHSSHASQIMLDEWVHQFNWIRPHQALKGLCPGQLYSNSTRSFNGTPSALSYPQTFLTRKVNPNGCIRIRDTQIFISTALASWQVGLLPLPNNFFQVWFDRILLGQIDLFCAKFIWASPDELDSSSSIPSA